MPESPLQLEYNGAPSSVIVYYYPIPRPLVPNNDVWCLTVVRRCAGARFTHESELYGTLGGGTRLLSLSGIRRCQVTSKELDTHGFHSAKSSRQPVAQ